ncbi:glycosyltransferase family 2 protein [Streptomyces acidiscabies]|uniref:glycosyltransferase family 2 protein n=1 Tax=Streptomyces acidiscabies TaxID=42234 RepID=UPI002FEEB6D1
MTSLISIITPIYDPHPEHLKAAHASLAAQTLPPGWSWEWIVQEDGGTGIAETLLPQDPRIRTARGRRGGVAITRNLGLSRAEGTLVKNLDQDDVLTPGALTRDIEALQDPATGWATSRALDLLPDGTTAANDNDPAPGPIPRARSPPTGAPTATASPSTPPPSASAAPSPWPWVAGWPYPARTTPASSSRPARSRRATSPANRACCTASGRARSPRATPTPNRPNAPCACA